MTTVTVPLDKEALRQLEVLEAANPEMSRAAIVRKAVRLMSEEEALQAVLTARREVDEGKVILQDAVSYLRKRIHKR